MFERRIRFLIVRLRNRSGSNRTSSATASSPGLVLDRPAVTEQEVAVENVHGADLEVGLAQHQLVVARVGQHDHVADHPEREVAPGVEIDVVVEVPGVPVGRVEPLLGLFLDQAHSEVADLDRAALLQLHLPLALIALPVLAADLVIAERAAVLPPEALLELLTREPADPLVVPAAVDEALELVVVRRSAAPHHLLELVSVCRSQRLERPGGHLASAIPGATYSASAMTVSCGFTVVAVGNTLASQTNRFSKPCTRKVGSTTPLPGSPLSAFPPCGWPLPIERYPGFL